MGCLLEEELTRTKDKTPEPAGMLGSGVFFYIIHSNDDMFKVLRFHALYTLWWQISNILLF